MHFLFAHLLNNQNASSTSGRIIQSFFCVCNSVIALVSSHMGMWLILMHQNRMPEVLWAEEQSQLGNKLTVAPYWSLCLSPSVVCISILLPIVSVDIGLCGVYRGSWGLIQPCCKDIITFLVCVCVCVGGRNNITVHTMKSAHCTHPSCWFNPF